jgi:nitrogen regulatory protein PII
MTEATLFFVIVNRGKANGLLRKSQGMGAKGGTILLGKGTLQSRIFDILGINQTQKEILLMAVPDHASQGIYGLLKEEFKLHRRFKGIAFSVPFRAWTKDTKEPQSNSNRHLNPHYVCVMAVIEKGKAEDCMAAAKSAGAQGGTIIAARGAGVLQDFYVPLLMEPQKEIVLIVLPHETAVSVREAIFNQMELDKQSSSIVFLLPVLDTIGLYEERRQEGSA